MAAYLFLQAFFPSGAALGPSRAAILEGIDSFGSISASARAVGLTYQGVWNAVKRINSQFPKPLVKTDVGGRRSGARLTPFGKKVLAHYRTLERDADIALRGNLKAFERLLGEDQKAPLAIPRWAMVRPEDAGVRSEKSSTKVAGRPGASRRRV